MKQKFFIGIGIVLLIILSGAYVLINIQEVNEKEIEKVSGENLELKLIEIANSREEVQKLMQNKSLNIETGIEEFPGYYRVYYKNNGIYLYGVDIEKNNMEIIENNFLD
jgi:hypothetical protein